MQFAHCRACNTWRVIITSPPPTRIRTHHRAITELCPGSRHTLEPGTQLRTLELTGTVSDTEP